MVDDYYFEFIWKFRFTEYVFVALLLMLMLFWVDFIM